MILSETNTGQLRIRVDDPCNGVVVYVAGLARDDFYAGDSFIFSLMRQHRICDHVADRINAFDVCAKMFVHFDPLLFIELDTDFFCAQTLRKRAAPN